MKNLKAIIFDLDGALIHSAPDVVISEWVSAKVRGAII
jgi:phosphoglycolate phosphatase-like HAD superfamily hydrolase